MVVQLPFLVVVLAFTAFPSANAALFPKKSNVKYIDAKGFREALQGKVRVVSRAGASILTLCFQNTFVTAFVAPWCGVSLLSWFNHMSLIIVSNSTARSLLRKLFVQQMACIL